MKKNAIYIYIYIPGSISPAGISSDTILKTQDGKCSFSLRWSNYYFLNSTILKELLTQNITIGSLLRLNTINFKSITNEISVISEKVI